MRMIDADELIEHICRERVDSRELIVQLIQNAPTVKQPYDEILVRCENCGYPMHIKKFTKEDYEKWLAKNSSENDNVAN